jgi:hypothetical protein
MNKNGEKCMLFGVLLIELLYFLSINANSRFDDRKLKHISAEIILF